MTAKQLAYTVKCIHCGKPAVVMPQRFDIGNQKRETHDMATCHHCGATWDYCCGIGLYIPGKRLMGEHVREART